VKICVKEKKRPSPDNRNDEELFRYKLPMVGKQENSFLAFFNNLI
jgi:hypothetical protein